MKFNHSPIQRLRLTQWVKEDPSLRRAFNKNITTDFFQELTLRIHGTKPDHIILYIYGETGTYKSSIAQSMAALLQEDFPVENVVFRNRAIIDRIQQIKPQEIIIRDESPTEYGVGTRRISDEIVTYTETLRKARISLFFIRPTFTYMPSCHFYLRTIDVSTDGTHVRLAVYDSVSEKCIGGIVVPIILNNPLWQQYEEKKDAFIKEVMSQDGKGLQVERLAQKVMEHEDFHDDMKKKEIRLLVYKTYKGMTTSELDLINTEIGLMLKKSEKL